MRAVDQFFDTNVLLYLLSGDDAKADRAEKALESGGVISIQVLNEFASVAVRKLKMPIVEIRDVLTTFRAVCKIVPLSEETHDKGLELAEKYRLSIYDCMIVASALLAGCKTLWSEDMHDGQIIEKSLQVRNPFR